MDEALRRLLSDLLTSIGDATDGLQAGMLTPDAWYNAIARELLAHHLAAAAASRNLPLNTPAVIRAGADATKAQLDYLGVFADAVARGEYDGRNAALRARALLYAGSLKATYSAGLTTGYDLPYYPGDGSSECLTNCGCRWQGTILDAEELDADWEWIRGKDDSCPTCMSRAGEVIRFRGGKRQ